VVMDARLADTDHPREMGIAEPRVASPATEEFRL
jgi:hypothetical protein